MIRLTKCSKNPNHWYSGHTTECPWCRITYDTGRDSFPPPDQNPGLAQISASQERYGSLPSQQTEEISEHPLEIPSHFLKIPMIGGVCIIGIIIFFIIIFANTTTTVNGGAQPTITPVMTTVKTVVRTALPTTIPQTSSASTNNLENGLRTYTNQQYKFSIDYPKNWIVSHDRSIVSFSPSTDPVVSISALQKSGTLQDFFLSNGPKKVESIPNAEITNHDFKTRLGYRIDYVIPEKDSIRTTKVMEIYIEDASKSQVIVITYRGYNNGYDQYTGFVDDMTRSFHLI
jgi:hypothetical protein